MKVSYSTVFAQTADEVWAVIRDFNSYPRNAQADRGVMARFKLIRQREADGTVDHVLEFFLVDTNGRALLQYMGERAEPEHVANDVERAAAGESVTAGNGASIAVALRR